MSKNAATVTGLNEIIQKLNQLPDRIKNKLQRGGMKAAIEPVKAEVLRRVPELDGGLRASIEDRVVRRKWGYAAQVRARAPHAHLMEYGWWWTTHAGRRVKRVGPYPQGGFLRPALYGNADKVRQAFKDTLEQAIKELAEKGGK